MANPLKREVLKAFKSLHKARLYVFRDDVPTLEAARKKINEEFSKYKNVTDKGSIEELLKFSSEVEKELKKRVVQAREVGPGKYEARITPETEKLVNVTYEDMPDAILAQGKAAPCSKK